MASIHALTNRFPVFLLAVYGKNEKANLSNAERNSMAKLLPALIQNYSEGSRRTR
jgi:hypothetical protein